MSLKNPATPATPATKSAIFVGDGSLLIRCAQVFRQAGHRVAAVLSGNPKVLQWAQGEGIPTLEFTDAAAIDLQRLDLGSGFDHLFSVANLHVLPPALIAQAREGALNFHDALLPDYAGLNATAWALMARWPA